MVNAKNAFMSTLIVGLVIAAVGSEKFHSGNWDTMSGDFTMGEESGKFATFNGRFYAENTNECSLSETGAVAKGTECDLYNDVDYQLEMTNTDVEIFANKDTITTTNLATGESHVSAQTAINSAQGESVEWSNKQGKLVASDGTVLAVQNAQSPGLPVRKLICFGSIPCNNILNSVTGALESAADWVIERFTTCSGLMSALAFNVLWCIGWIVYLLVTSAITVATIGTTAGAALIGIPGFAYHCGYALANIVLVVLVCGYEILAEVWKNAGGEHDSCFEGRQLRGSNPGGWGQGGGTPTGGGGMGANAENSCTEDAEGGPGGCRRLNIAPSRMLTRHLGGGGEGGGCSRNLGGGGEGGYKAPEDDCGKNGSDGCE